MFCSEKVPLESCINSTRLIKMISLCVCFFCQVLVLPRPSEAWTICLPDEKRLCVHGHGAAWDSSRFGLPPRASPLRQRRLCHHSHQEHSVRSAFPRSDSCFVHQWEQFRIKQLPDIPVHVSQHGYPLNLNLFCPPVQERNLTLRRCRPTTWILPMTSIPSCITASEWLCDCIHKNDNDNNNTFYV